MKQSAVISAVALCAAIPVLASQPLWITSADTTSTSSMPLFTKTFVLESVPSDVMLQCTALGVYDVSVNGRRVDMGLLNPGWTDYRHEVMQQEADITPLLTPGQNRIDIQLSNGWWNGAISRGAYGPDTPLCARACITAGNDTIAVTDGSWTCCTDGPLLLGDIYDGESYDARRTPSAGHAARIHTGAVPEVIAQQGPVVRERPRRLWREPASITVYSGSIPSDTGMGRVNVVRRPTAGEPLPLMPGETMLVDFGQNFAGVVALGVTGDRGTRLTVRHGEMLNDTGDRDGRLDDGPAGSLWTYNLREADARISYTLAGDSGGEAVRPRHTFMGFRYIEITATGPVTLSGITGIPIGSEIEEWGTFECSDPDISRLYSNTWWSQRSNFLSVPTDCPQRDERLGWTGDTQIFSRTALYNSNAAGFYRKWMRDMRNSQRSDGAYPDIAPWNNFWGYGTAAWGDAGVIVPWNVYELTGDTAIIAENYDSMTRWTDYLATQSEATDSVVWTHTGGGTATGDWLAYEPLDARYVAMAYYACVADLMARMARVMGRTADEQRYTTLGSDIRSEFNHRYVNPDGTLRATTQTAYLLALRHNLLPPQHRKAAAQALRHKIHSNGNRLSTGFVGTPLLCQVLSDLGDDDLAYTLLQQRGNPSWLYSIDQGATTIWERWDSYTREGGFHKHPWNMNSFNHYAYGAIVEWMYSRMCGIQPAAPGYGRLLLAPRPDRRPDTLIAANGQRRIDRATASTMTPHGRVTSGWERRPDGSYLYTFDIPAGLPYDIDIPFLTRADDIVITHSN